MRYTIRDPMGLVIMGIALFWSSGQINWWRHDERVFRINDIVVLMIDQACAKAVVVRVGAATVAG